MATEAEKLDWSWRKKWSNVAAILRKKYPKFQYSGRDEFGIMKICVWYDKNCIKILKVHRFEIKFARVTYVERFLQLMETI